MQPSTGFFFLVSFLLVLGSFFFVAAEYAIVSSRRSRIEALARRGNRTAKALARSLENISPLVAASQIGITMIGIGVGSVTEPFVTGLLVSHLGQVDRRVGYVISFLLVAFVLVVLGELCPKYLSLRLSERMALLTYRPLRFFTAILLPLVWLAQSTAGLLLRPFGIDIREKEGESVPKDELVMLVQSGGSEGVLDKRHAEMVTRALKLDVLDARDIMIHRLDIQWLDIDLPKQELQEKLREIPHTRIPVCRGDIDELAGIAYLHDIVKSWDQPDFNLEKVLRPAVAVPENLPMEKIVTQMRDSKTQILIVMDEYGGTSGLITLEDVVEEIFGELEDRLESERPPIENHGHGRISARADVRFDELVSTLDLRIDTGERTETLAQMIVDQLGRIPRPGDSVQTELGLMRVENMARRRVTRVSIQLARALLAPPEE